MRRRFISALVIAMITAGLVGFTARPSLAWSSCPMGISWNNSNTDVTAYGYLNDVTFNEKPGFMFVDWGDGTSFYQEKNQTGSMAWLPSHTYAAAGSYTTYFSIGTLGEGESDCQYYYPFYITPGL